MTTLTRRHTSLGPGGSRLLYRTALAENELLAFVEAVKDELHACGNSQLVKDSKKVISNDCGSTTLGFVIAVLALDFWRSPPAAVTVPTLYFPFLLCALPLLDAAFAILRRLRRLKSPLSGDRSHLYDLLGARGYSPVQVALTCYAMTIAFAGISRIELQMSPVEAAIVAALSFAALAVLEVRLGSLRLEHKPVLPAVFVRAVSRKRAPNL